MSSLLYVFPTMTPFSPKLKEAYEVKEDFCTEYQGKLIWVPLFYQMLRDAGVGKVRAVLMRETVETMGRFYWANDDKDKAFLEKLRQKIVDDGRDPLKYGLKDE